MFTGVFRGAETVEHVSLERLTRRFYETEPHVPVRAEFAAMTHPGKVRDRNEDHYLVVRRSRTRDVLATSLPVELLAHSEQTAYTVAVADGMGGHAFGEVASLLALLTGWELGGGEIKWTVKMNEEEEEDLRLKADVFFRLIDRALHDAADERPRLAGMGTTLTLTYSFGPWLFVMHAGDSRAYLHRGGAIRRLTKDHTLSQMLIESGTTEPGSALERERRHILVNYLGGPARSVSVDFSRHELEDGDRLVLCSDGLTDLVSDDEIAEILNRHDELDAACGALVDVALDRGGRDNITVVVGRYTFAEPPLERAALT